MIIYIPFYTFSFRLSGSLSPNPNSNGSLVLKLKSPPPWVSGMTFPAPVSLGL